MRLRRIIGPFSIIIIGLFALPVWAYATVIVTPSNLQGWTPYTRSDATVAITGDFPRNGSGSLKFESFTVTPGQDKADFSLLWNVVPGRVLGNITRLQFDAYRSSSSTTADHFAPVFRLIFYHDPGTPGRGCMEYSRYNQ